MKRAASHLLSVDRLRTSEYRVTRLYPAAVAILNLFFCAYFERYLNSDVTGFHLSLFLFLESSAYAALSTTNFFTVSSEILSKSRVFPTTPTDRMLFVIKGNCRRLMQLSLVGSNIFFVVILFRATPSAAILAVLIFLLFTLTIEILLSVSLLILQRQSLPLEGAIAIAGFVLLSLLLGSIVFHYEILIASLPLMKWAVDGMLGATRNETSGVILSFAMLLITSTLMLVLGRRFA